MDLTDRIGHPDVGDLLTGRIVVAAVSGDRVLYLTDQGISASTPYTCRKLLTSAELAYTRERCRQRSLRRLRLLRAS